MWVKEKEFWLLNIKINPCIYIVYSSFFFACTHTHAQDLDRIAAEEEERKRKASRLVVPSSSQELAQQHIFQLGNGPSSGAAPLGLPASTTAGRGGFGASPAAYGGSSFGGASAR